MYSPEKPYLMIKPVKPVIKKIFHDQQHYPVQYHIAERKELVLKKII
jgi:hypothetical protein